MKLITLGWVAHSLEMLVYEIKVSDDVRERAKVTLERMLAVTGEKKEAALAGY
ncbi:MAG: quinolinate synthase NadA, partial [Candidatus Omnitrophica bacterium]|nr:quinolinate synthase NadA [Candidatus Omnitrophota bacterium]